MPYLSSKKTFTSWWCLSTHINLLLHRRRPSQSYTRFQEQALSYLACICLTGLKPLFLSSLQLRPSYVPTAKLVAYSKTQIELLGTVTSCISSQRTKIGIFFRRHFLLYLVLVDLNVLSDVLHPLLIRLSHSPADFTASPRFAIIHSFHHSCFYDPK